MVKDKNKNKHIQDSSRYKLAATEDFANLQYYFQKIKKETKVSGNDLFLELTSEPKIPVSVFNETLSGLETIAKYLRENINLEYKVIAKLLKRSSKTIWQAHSFSKKKFPQKFQVQHTEFLIPVSALSNRNLSILESITIYLKESLGLKHHEIASLLKRDQSTIWTVYNRAKHKIK